MGLKVINLYSENIKRLRAVDITPQGSTVIISGKNEQGKSSILDSIWLACKYSAASKEIPNPIRDGEDHALIVLNLGEYTVTRQFRLNDEEQITTRLTVERSNGDVVKSPQALIDSFIGSLSFDPLEFMRQAPKQQREMLAEISKLNLAELDANYKKLFEERTGLNREIKSLSSNIVNIAPPTDTTALVEEDPATLFKELEDAKDEWNVALQLVATRESVQLEIAAIEGKLHALRTKLNEINHHVVNSPTPDSCKNKVDSLTDRMKRISEINGRIKEAKFYHDTNEKIKKAQNRTSEIETEIQTIKAERAKAIEEAELPIEGLLIEDEGVTFKGQALSQLSTSQQIKISMVLAMAANPELRIIRIKDGSLLDKENLALIDEIAKNGDFQVWIECVDDSGKMGFYIEDGKIAATNECIT